MSGSVFEQHFHAPVENVYNVSGDLILSKESNAGDVVRELSDLRGQIERLSGMETGARETSLQAVDAAIDEGKKPKPKGAQIQEHLATAASTVENACGAAENGLKLAKTLVSIGKWVLTFL